MLMQVGHGDVCVEDHTRTNRIARVKVMSRRSPTCDACSLWVSLTGDEGNGKLRGNCFDSNYWI